MKRILLMGLWLITWGLAAQTSAEDWPRWRGPEGNGTWHGPRLHEDWNAHPPKPLWKQKLGGGYGGVAVVGNRVYVLDRQADPTEQERLHCLDADTGESLWVKSWPVKYNDLSYGNGPRTTPTIHKGKVYVLGSLGHLHCVEATTGRSVWSHDYSAEIGKRLPMWGLSGSPVVFENSLLVHLGRENACLTAFDLETGKILWEILNDPAGYATPVLISRPFGPEVILWTSENVHGLDPRAGKVHWTVPYKSTYGVAIATPIYHENILLVSGYWEGSKAIKLGDQPEQAELAWTDNDVLRGLMSQPLYREGFAWLLDKRFGLTCFDYDKGQKLWDDQHQMTPRDRNPQATMVWTGHENRVLILNASGELIHARLTPERFVELGRTPIIGSTWAHPAYAGQRVYARSDEEVVCVELPVAE